MKTKEFHGGSPISFKDSIDYSDNAIVSKQVIKKSGGNVTLFAFDKGQGLSEHTAPFDALVQVLEGEARISIDKNNYHIREGSCIIMPAGISHAVYAQARFKMLLTMIKSE